MSEYSDELRVRLAQLCAKELDVECDADVITVGSDFADAVVRVAFLYPIDAKDVARRLSAVKCEIGGENVIAKAEASGRYVNVILSDEYLRQLANTIITNYPLPQELGCSRYDYAIARAVMLSRKSDDFPRVIRDARLRRTFIELIKCSDGTKCAVAERFLAAQGALTEYDGMGKYADCAARILTKYRKGNEL